MDAASIADVLKSILTRHSQYKLSHGKIQVCPVFDEQAGHYGLIDVGWSLGRRVHSLIFFARVIDGVLRLEWDGLGHGITDELIAAGVPESLIVHAWMEPCPPGAQAHPRPPKAASA